MDPSSSGAGSGRSRGRARGRAQPLPPADLDALSGMQAIRISGSGDGGNGNGNGNGNGSGTGSNGNGNGSNGNGGEPEGAGAVRGRGGYRGRPEDIDTRPADVAVRFGMVGTEIQLLSNYFRLRTPTNVVVNDFHVTFEPAVEVPKIRRQLIYGIPNLFDGHFLFDGMSLITSMTSELGDREHVVNSPETGKDVRILIRHTVEVPWGSEQMLRVYNTQMRRNLQHIGYNLMGRNYYDIKSKRILEGHPITLLPGVITAIAQHDGGLMMVVDSSTKFIRNETVLKVLGEIKARGGNWFDEAKKQICGAIVMTSYDNKTYKVDDLTTEKTCVTAVFNKAGVEMNLMRYYKEFKGIDIRQPSQPLIECLPNARDRRAGRTDKILLVPELCQLTGLTDEMRSNFTLMRQIGDISRLKPSDRASNLKAFIDKVATNPNVKTDMEKWNIDFDPNLVQIAGRLLPCERIYGGTDDDNTAKDFDQKSGDFSRAIRSKMLFKAVTISKWIIIVTKRDMNLVNEFGDTLRRVSGPMGIKLQPPRTTELTDDRLPSFINALQTLPAVCEMAVIIVPNNNKERYDAIKKITYCEKGMASQVIVGRTLSKKQMLMSVCTKIAIQMATKLGGQPWALKIPPKEVMVCGYDTYHDSAQKGRSVGAFVCSMNQTLTSWYSRVAYHGNQEEMSANFALNLKEGIKRFYELNDNKLPKRVIVYRDGVGDGMIPHVFEYELKQITDALKSINPNDPPQLTFIIVTKRVNARFFTRSGQNYDNPIPGTIVDRDVTRLMRYDFYLISQSVRQGTVTPTMYNIIYDKSGYKPEHHQQLAYKLTHLYFNWMGTITVPAPCQYAHKLAYLTGTSLHREPNAALSDRLFYL